MQSPRNILQVRARGWEGCVLEGDLGDRDGTPVPTPLCLAASVFSSVEWENDADLGIRRSFEQVMTSEAHAVVTSLPTLGLQMLLMGSPVRCSQGGGKAPRLV